MVTATSFYGVDLGPADPTPAAPAELVEVFDLMRPQASQTRLIRIGGDIDGSYLVPDLLEGIAACYSPGVNRIKYFEDYLTDRYGIASHMCDFTCDVDEFRTPLRPGLQTFQKKWLDVAPGPDNLNLEEWVSATTPAGDLLLQMDIEGAEYRNVLATSDETLARFRVIVLEVHGLGRMLDGPTLRGAIAPFFRKLARSFTAVHAHPNNCCGDFAIPGTDIRIPQVLELTFVRNDAFVAGPGAPLLPHPLDVGRNVPRNPPLFLSEAWCGGERPLASRVKMLEDNQDYRATVGDSAGESELAGVLAMTMQSVQTATDLVPRPSRAALREVAEGCRYELSAPYGASARRGVVKQRDGYFFHTAFGPNQFIRVDLGEVRQVRRIEVSNRTDGHQDRARYLFAQLARTRRSGAPRVFPMLKNGRLPDGAWQECGLDLPDVEARFVTIASPVNTALHFSDLRVYVAPEPAPVPVAAGGRARRALGAVRRRVASRLR